MLLLIGFALVAGAGTALSPCVLPVLPAVLSAGVTGGRRRPLGVITGLVISFTFAIVVLVYVIDALGLPNDLLRTLAIVVLIGFGVVAADPAGLGAVRGLDLAASPARRRAPGGDGFGSGLLLGGSLGLALRAVRGAGAGGRDHGVGGAGLHRRAAGRRARVRDRVRRSSCTR